MFCKNCGTQFEDGQAFCPNCGQKNEAAEAVSEAVSEVKEAAGTTTSAAENKAPVASAAPQYKAPSFDAEKSGSKILPLAVAGVVVIAAIIILVALFSGGAKKSVKNYMKALKKGDSKKMLTLTVPKSAREDYVDDVFDTDLDEYYEAMDEVNKNFWDNMKDEGKVKFEYEIKNCEKLGKLDKLKKDAKEQMNVKSLNDFQDEYEEFFDKSYDIDSSDIKKVYVAEIKWKVTVDGKNASKGTDLAAVYKYKGDWYVLGAPSISSIVSELDSDDYKSVIKDFRQDLTDAFK